MPSGDPTLGGKYLPKTFQSSGQSGEQRDEDLFRGLRAVRKVTRLETELAQSRNELTQTRNELALSQDKIDDLETASEFLDRQARAALEQEVRSGTATEGQKVAMLEADLAQARNQILDLSTALQTKLAAKDEENTELRDLSDALTRELNNLIAVADNITTNLDMRLEGLGSAVDEFDDAMKQTNEISTYDLIASGRDRVADAHNVINGDSALEKLRKAVATARRHFGSYLADHIGPASSRQSAVPKRNDVQQAPTEGPETESTSEGGATAEEGSTAMGTPRDLVPKSPSATKVGGVENKKPGVLRGPAARAAVAGVPAGQAQGGGVLVEEAPARNISQGDASARGGAQAARGIAQVAPTRGASQAATVRGDAQAARGGVQTAPTRGAPQVATVRGGAQAARGAPQAARGAPQAARGAPQADRGAAQVAPNRGGRSHEADFQGNSRGVNTRGDARNRGIGRGRGSRGRQVRGGTTFIGSQ